MKNGGWRIGNEKTFFHAFKKTSEMTSSHRPSEHGFGLLAVISGIGLLVAILTGTITMVTVTLAGQAKTSESEHRERWEFLSAFRRAAWSMSDTAVYDRPPTTEWLRAVSQRVATDTGSGPITIEDESGKVNVNAMAYFLPSLLTASPVNMNPVEADRLITEIEGLQGLLDGRTATGNRMPWRTEAALGMDIEPADPQPPMNRFDERHCFMVRQRPDLPPWRGWESPDDWRLLWDVSGLNPEALERLRPMLTAAPTLGLNLNTTTVDILKVVTAWQRDVMAAHPSYAQAIDQRVMLRPPFIPFRKVSDRLYGTSITPRNAKTLMLPRFRDLGVNNAGDAAAAIAQRQTQPYQMPEILQLLAAHSLIFPMLYEWKHFSPVEAVHLKVTGPGPYTAHSSGHYTMRMAKGRLQMKIAVVIGRGGFEPRVRQWEEESL